jgi:hypothetical protein
MKKTLLEKEKINKEIQSQKGLLNQKEKENLQLRHP